jgi:hypothetical protein
MKESLHNLNKKKERIEWQQKYPQPNSEQRRKLKQTCQFPRQLWMRTIEAAVQQPAIGPDPQYGRNSEDWIRAKKPYHIADSPDLSESQASGC